MEQVLPVIAITVSTLSLIVATLGFRRAGRANGPANERVNVKWELQMCRINDHQARVDFKNAGSSVAHAPRFTCKLAFSGAEQEITFPESRVRRLPPGKTHSLVSDRTIDPIQSEHFGLVQYRSDFIWEVSYKSALGTLFRDGSHQK